MSDSGPTTSKWRRVADELDRHIASLSVGDELPSERALSERFSVARMTVRRALDHLERTGRIRRDHGRGTFVGPSRFAHDESLASFSRQMRSRGLRPSSTVLTQKVVRADRQIASDLGIRQHSRVVRLERLRRADGIPLAWEEVYLPADLVSGIEDEDLATGSLWDLLESHYGLSPTTALQTIRAVVLDQFTAELLTVATGDPAFEISRVSFTDEGEAVERLRSLFRSDLYEVRLSVHAQ
ncbi:GntR family transcriptional regulator [soil metagenome]